jgi:predicted ATP-grasp superfamily ATP-dependent carboligase
LYSDLVLIFGASVRAAAFSALRAGLRPWCADLFADADLCLRCPTQRLTGRYPGGFAELIGSDIPGPWLYTGGLENHPRLVERMARRRPLWGNDGPVLVLARDPQVLVSAATAAGLPAPALARLPAGTSRWLIKPFAGAGGGGIRFWCEGDVRLPRGTYLQQFIDGSSLSAVYVAIGGASQLLGVTRQLVGEGWLHAPPFRYCGSIGPLTNAGLSGLEALGQELVERTGLRGLFGIDGVQSGGSFYPVEVNPRYTASIEVLEHSTGLRILDLHRRAFEVSSAACGFATPSAIVGKAILYARADLVFPGEGPWQASLDIHRPIEDMSDFADLPHPGDCIPLGHPILTILARSLDEAACLRALQERAAGVEACLYAGG